MILGIIQEGKLKDHRIILEPRIDLLQNEYLVEQGRFLNGEAMFQKACLVCEEFISDHCPNQHN